MQSSSARTDADFEALYERHWRYVYRLCFSYMRSAADAEDCTEDVFVKILTGNLTFADETHERKWLTVAACNLCKDRLKSYGRTHTDSLDEEDAPEIAAPEEEDNSDVLEAVLALPPKLKDVVWMYYYDGLPTEEIATALGRAPSTVRNQLRDARGILRTVLERSNR